MGQNTADRRNLIREKLGKLKGAFVAVGLLSAAVNILMLTGPMFMLQVYDRVLTSQSVPTLVALLLLAVALYIMMGIFDFLRIRVLSRISHWLDAELSPLAFRSWMIRSLSGHYPGYKPIQDLSAVRGFFASPTILALFDLPWVPFYLAVVFVLHVQLGLLATAGAIVVVVIGLINEWISSRSMSKMSSAELSENRFVDQAQKNADAVLAMGMLGNTLHNWKNLRGQTLGLLQTGSERSEFFTTFSKSFRLLLQSMILGLGGYLAIQGEISGGMIVAASIIAGRALAPIDQTIGGWRMIKRSRQAYKRLADYLARDAESALQTVDLPEPVGNIELEEVVKFAPNPDPTMDKVVILSGLSFQLKPGDGLGVIGPSASGKSTLAKILVGLWMPDRGSMRIDGATFEQWDVDKIGRHVGYLPQHMELICGSIAQNICRFDPEAEHEEIVEAARMANIHEMILQFQDGYGTDVDSAISPLTGGQKQRIALARAVYRKPKLVVLDEPNSNLDAQGDAALAHAIGELRNAGSVVVVMAHRPSAIAAVDKVLMLNDGMMVEFGDKNEVLRKVTVEAGQARQEPGTGAR